MTQTTTRSGTIRALTSADLEAVIVLDAGLSKHLRRSFFEKRLEAALKAPKDYVYVGMRKDGRLIGFAMARLIDGEFGKPIARALLDALGVDPAGQSHGAGHDMLDVVKDILIHKGVTKLESQVDWADRTLLGFLGDTGFGLGTSLVLIRSTEGLPSNFSHAAERDDTDNWQEIDHSSPHGDDFAALSRDRIPVRSMQKSDLDTIVRIDRKLSGSERTVYCQRKLNEAIDESGIRVSLVAELDGLPVGFIMAGVDFGEFGHTNKEAAMDTIGVDPEFRGQGVAQALMSQLMAHLSILRVETVRTEVDWNNTELVSFFSEAGFVPAQRMALVSKL